MSECDKCNEAEHVCFNKDPVQPGYMRCVEHCSCEKTNPCRIEFLTIFNAPKANGET